MKRTVCMSLILILSWNQLGESTVAAAPHTEAPTNRQAPKHSPHSAPDVLERAENENLAWPKNQNLGEELVGANNQQTDADTFVFRYQQQVSLTRIAFSIGDDLDPVVGIYYVLPHNIPQSFRAGVDLLSGGQAWFHFVVHHTRGFRRRLRWNYWYGGNLNWPADNGGAGILRLKNYLARGGTGLAYTPIKPISIEASSDLVLGPRDWYVFVQAGFVWSW